MKFTRDELGIPILNAEDIEQLTERFLGRAAPFALVSPSFTPLAEIMGRIQRSNLCSFSFDEHLGHTTEGYKYLGYFNIKRKHIAIDASLSSEDVRFPFTVAHELGHFYLHGDISPTALRADSSDGLRDSTRDLVTHRIDASSARSLLEWQANRFAAGILMPRRTVRDAVIQIQRERGLKRNLGMIWLDRQGVNRVEYKRTLGQLSSVYRVSQAVVRYRMRELGILQVDANTMLTRVGDTLGDALAELFPG
ncbi:MAG: ImmA/IrrE family metallo-endopeptidase [Gemmatimonadota bacterium]